MASPPLVAIDGLTKSFPTGIGTAAIDVLTDVELQLERGQKASLIGPSGSGKSTLLALIAGLLRPDSGTIAIDGVPLTDLGDTERARLRARRIGIALQADNLIPFLTARENVEMAMGFAGRHNRREARQRAVQLLERLTVAHRADQRPHHLSGGEAQRVALAVAMANNPALLLADEVVAQLDGETAGHVFDELLAGDYAVLYVTHDLALADRVELRYQLSDYRVERR